MTAMPTNTATAGTEKGDQEDFVTMKIADQWFGIPVLGVQEVLGEQRIARVPLAPPEVAGNLNLRGRIATAIDIRKRLGLAPREEHEPEMSVVVDHHGELYSLLIDSVGEVLSLPMSSFERNPPTIAQHIREVSLGIYRLDEKLLVVLDVERLLDTGQEKAA